jgi:hypothetical protein
MVRADFSSMKLPERHTVFILLLLGFLVHSVSGAEPGQSPTFSRDIAPIVYKNCTSCHRPGQSAPFTLRTYSDFTKRLKLVNEVVSSGQMPPWMPVPGYGEFESERHLTSAEMSLFTRWVEAGAPEGDPALLPPAPAFVEGWQLGKPDLVLELNEPYLLSAAGEDTYRNFVLPIPLASPRYVAGLEFRPGTNRVVHHAFFYVDRSGTARKLDAEDV